MGVVLSGILGLVGCGGAPQRPTPRVAAVAVVGGAYTAGCLRGEVLVAIRGAQQETWRLAADPVLEATGPVSPAPAAGCTPSGQAALADGRVVAWGPDGLLLGETAATLRAWRPAPAELTAAAYDGRRMRAVGPSGLWQWQPGPGLPVPVPLPPELAGHPLNLVFHDGPLLWVGDAAGLGAPLDLRGPVPVLAGPPGTMPPADPMRHALLEGHRVEARQGVAGLAFDGQPQPTPGPVGALLPLDDLLWVATGDALIGYRWQGGPDPAVRVELGGATVALFAEGPGQLLAVGAHYGFARVTLVSPEGGDSAPPFGVASPPPDPTPEGGAP